MFILIANTVLTMPLPNNNHELMNTEFIGEVVTELLIKTNNPIPINPILECFICTIMLPIPTFKMVAIIPTNKLIKKPAPKLFSPILSILIPLFKIGVTIINNPSPFPTSTAKEPLDTYSSFFSSDFGINKPLPIIYNGTLKTTNKTTILMLINLDIPKFPCNHMYCSVKNSPHCSSIAYTNE